LQHGQSQLFASPLGVLALVPFDFIGHESPLQQSQLSQHDAVSLPDASCFFIGQESPLQQQQAAAALTVPLVRTYANAAIDRASRAKTANAIMILFFI